MHGEVCKLISAHDFPYRGGAYLTQSDIEGLKITLDPKASTGFWKSSSSLIRRALQGTLEEIFINREITLNETNECKKNFIESHCPTIDYAYKPSFEYNRLLEYLVHNGMFRNGLLVDSLGDGLFQSLRYVPVPPIFAVSYCLHVFKASTFTGTTYIWRPTRCSAPPAIHTSPSFLSSLNGHHVQRSFYAQNFGHYTIGLKSFSDVLFIRPTSACR